MAIKFLAGTPPPELQQQEEQTNPPPKKGTGMQRRLMSEPKPAPLPVPPATLRHVPGLASPEDGPALCSRSGQPGGWRRVESWSWWWIDCLLGGGIWVRESPVSWWADRWKYAGGELGAGASDNYNNQNSLPKTRGIRCKTTIAFTHTHLDPG